MSTKHTIKLWDITGLFGISWEANVKISRDFSAFCSAVMHSGVAEHISEALFSHQHNMALTLAHCEWHIVSGTHHKHTTESLLIDWQSTVSLGASQSGRHFTT